MTTADIAAEDTETAESATQSIGRQATRGLKWSLAGTLLNKAGSFALGLALARLLAPADFGVFAVAFATMQLVMVINDVGLIAATVQWRGELEEISATATTMAIAFSAVIYLGFWLAAPVIAEVSAVPQATGVIRLLTVVILIDGATAVRSAALMRTFRQDKLIQANLVGMLVNAAVAIALAVSGAGAYAFAGGLVAGTAITGVLVFVWTALPLRIGFDRAIARKLLAFGLPLAASLGVEAILINAAYIIVGHITGATELGYYLLAFNISTWALSILSTAVRYVSVAGFSRLSEVDTETLSAGVQASLPILVTVLVPVAVLMAILANPLIAVLYGVKWSAAAPVLPFLMVLTVVRVLTGFALDILIGSGATKAALRLYLIWATALIPVLLLATDRGGIAGAAIAQAAAAVLVALPTTIIALHRLGVRLRPVLPKLVRPVLGGLLAGVLAWLATHFLGVPLVALLVGGIAGLIAYAVTAVDLSQVRRMLRPASGKEAHAAE
ncbi:MAG: oligosaccharide flippase family protein [Hamadaea sp.]|uniref:oligosaccharide flippase family protein n=1 Tax=Hamadaea sp. TaxID=2024425 RepID=UPI0017F898C8|nr:oligosaccharide flippase family protein [Hamadaea sp.]NUR70152.1 oligosaccharide flippase family protein [Hamadaea sp.]NUT23534.1 oligosaccharide flippase family protein [Hamadaea sp.]